MRICRFSPKDGPVDEDSVLYFLHYATGDERSFARIGLARSFFARYRRRGKPAPRVVAVSFGEHWILSREPGKRQIVPLEPFLRTLTELAPAARRRYIWGMSMGGYNSAVLALSAPEQWRAAALSCPALHAESPFLDSIEPGLLKLPGATATAVQDGRVLFTTRMAGPEVWDRENPVTLARHAGTPAFLIQANAQDEFGFVPGARALAAALREGHASVDLRELPGGHCVINGAEVADFLIDLP